MAMLGYLSWRPFTGYDLKKIIAASEILPWSGNNNQVYRTLLGLHREGLLTVEVEQQESLPPRKTYCITAAGRRELKAWAASDAAAPSLRSPLLMQLCWADALSADELTNLLDRYEREITLEEARVREVLRRRADVPDRTPRETYLWTMVHQNRLAFYRGELAWLHKLRKGLEQ